MRLDSGPRVAEGVESVINAGTESRPDATTSLPDADHLLICPLCSDIVDMAEAVTIKHVPTRGPRTEFEVCARCENKILCPENPTGIHSEVITEVKASQGIVELDRAGYCINCKALMLWVIPMQRWECIGQPDNRLPEFWQGLWENEKKENAMARQPRTAPT